MIKAALAAGSIFGATATQAELPSPDTAGIEAVQPAEQTPSTTTTPDTSQQANPALELVALVVELNLPTLHEALALAAIGAEGLVSDQDLADQRGGAAIVVADQDLSQIMAGNVLNGDYVAGNITVSDNAFSNFTGIGNVLINTGGLANIQSGINLTINTGP